MLKGYKRSAAFLLVLIGCAGRVHGPGRPDAAAEPTVRLTPRELVHRYLTLRHRITNSVPAVTICASDWEEPAPEDSAVYWGSLRVAHRVTVDPLCRVPASFAADTTGALLLIRYRADTDTQMVFATYLKHTFPSRWQEEYSSWNYRTSLKMWEFAPPD